MLISISAPPSNERGAAYVEQVLRSLHDARVPLTLIFGQHGDTVGLFCRCHDYDAETVRSQLNAIYIDCTIDVIPDDALEPHEGDHVSYINLRLRPDYHPLRVYREYDDLIKRNNADPLTGILAALLGQRESSIRSRIDISIRPASWLRRKRALWKVRRLDDPRVNERMNQHLFATHIRLFHFAPPDELGDAQLKLHDLAAVLGQFTVRQRSRFRKSWFLRHHYRRPRWYSRRFLLSDEELATIWHPALHTVRAPRMEVTESRQMEPPTGLPLKKRERGLAALGRVSFRDQDDVFGVLPDDRRRHLAVTGKTGMGKTTMLQNCIVADIREGRGVGLIDPHGDLADSILEAIPRQRTNDVIVIDPTDTDYPVSFNPLDVPVGMEDLACDGVVSTFRKLFATGDFASWGPRLEDILWNTVLALIYAGDATLLDILRMFRDDSTYRNDVLSRVKDPVVRDWWINEFPSLKNTDGDPFASVKNKLRQLLTTETIRNIIAQPKTRLRIREAMDTGKIVVVNLCKGGLGERTSSFLGSLLVTQFQLAAMTRSNIPEEERTDFFLYVDEFQNFATDSFETILSEARKYRLCLTIANQYLAQLPPKILNAVFGNVGSHMVFNVGTDDADVLSRQLAGDLTLDDLIALPKFRAYIRLLIDGQPSRGFSMETLPPSDLQGDEQDPAVVRRRSNEQYARPASEVARTIERAFAVA